MLFSICQRELSMPKTLEFITDHLPRVTVDEVRRFVYSSDADTYFQRL